MVSGPTVLKTFLSVLKMVLTAIFLRNTASTGPYFLLPSIKTRQICYYRLLRLTDWIDSIVGSDLSSHSSKKILWSSKLVMLRCKQSSVMWINDFFSSSASQSFSLCNPFHLKLMDPCPRENTQGLFWYNVFKQWSGLCT